MFITFFTVCMGLRMTLLTDSLIRYLGDFPSPLKALRPVGFGQILLLFHRQHCILMQLV